MESIRVLLIEDSPTHVAVVRGNLEGNGTATFELTVADTLADGVDQLGKGTFDAVLLDLTLPDSEGLNTFVRVADAADDLPVVIFTSVDDEELALTALHHGAADYLVKSEVNAAWLRRALLYAVHRERRKDPAEETMQQASSFQQALTVAPDDKTVEVRFNERRMVNVVVLEAIQERLVRVLNRSDGKTVRLDFTNVEYCANAAMSMLLLLHKRAKVVGVELLFCNVSPTVREHFASRRFDRVFRFENSGE